jgi:hypothetical protein
VNQERKATTTAKTNTGILRLRCSQSAVSNFAQDDKVFRWSKKKTGNSNSNSTGKKQRQEQLQGQQQIPFGDDNQKDRQQQLQRQWQCNAGAAMMVGQRRWWLR